IIDTLFPSLLTIQQGVLLGVRAGIALHDHSGRRFRLGRVVIKAGATIGSDAVIGPGVEIGEHAIVGMGAVVLRDVPPGALVLGNPARVVNRIGGEM
ncbi:acyltransferase, partial [bacterium]|nr:acyltransferase [bacterium]